MQTSRFLKIIIFFMSSCASSLILSAEVSSKDITPSSLEKLEEGDESGITIRQPGGERAISEKRENGRVTEIKVHSGHSTYYLKPNTPAGSALPGDAQSNAIRAPQWELMEFEFGRQNKDGAAIVPPPPALPITTPPKQ